MIHARALTAEALGTGLLVCTVIGSGIMADRLSDDVAVSLLGNTIPTGAILVVLITLLGPVSGAHFNPVVSMIFALRRDLAPMLLLGYVTAQIGGGILGTWVAHAMFEETIFQLATNARTGPAQWWAEVVATFGLLTVILGGLRSAPHAIPMMVGLYITAAYWFTASTSFANPAVAIARAFSDTFAGIDPAHVAGFIGAQVLGALIAWRLCAWLFVPKG